LMLFVSHFLVCFHRNDVQWPAYISSSSRPAPIQVYLLTRAGRINSSAVP
jgi:hypothetical protein